MVLGGYQDEVFGNLCMYSALIASLSSTLGRFGRIPFTLRSVLMRFWKRECGFIRTLWLKDILHRPYPERLATVVVLKVHRALFFVVKRVIQAFVRQLLLLKLIKDIIRHQIQVLNQHDNSRITFKQGLFFSASRFFGILIESSSLKMLNQNKTEQWNTVEHYVPYSCQMIVTT